MENTLNTQKKVRTQKDIQNHPATFDIYKSTENGWVLELNDGWEWAPDAQICNEPTLKEMCYVLNELVYKKQKDEPIKEVMTRKDTKTEWAWDFKVDGFNFWMTAQKDSEGMWSFVTWYDGDMLSTDFDTRKWTGWEKRLEYVKPFFAVTDQLNLPSVAVEKAKKKVAKVKKDLSGLNAKEQLVFKELYFNTMDCTSGDFGFTDEVILRNTDLGMTKPQLKGYIGSIVKKELIWVDYSEENNQFGLTDKGWEVVSALNLK